MRWQQVTNAEKLPAGPELSRGSRPARQRQPLPYPHRCSAIGKYIHRERGWLGWDFLEAVQVIMVMVFD